MTRESTKENKPATFKAIFLKPIRLWLTLNRRSPDSQHSAPPVIQHQNSSLHSVTMDDMSVITTTTTTPTDHNEPNNRTYNGGSSDEHFKRSARNRMSLPIMQQNQFRRQAYSQLQIRGQQQPRSLGHIYLQYKGETKQANLPNELTAFDTIRALFVCAFPNMLSMEFMSRPHVKIYIYDPNCNLFYELRNIDDVRHESVLRIHQSDPTYLALPPPQHYPTMRLLPPIPQRQQLQQQHSPHPLPLPQQQQQQPPLQRTPNNCSQQQQMTPNLQQQQQHHHHHHQQQPQQQQLMDWKQQQPIHHQMAPHQISPHLQIPPPKPRRMIPVMNGGLNGVNSMNNLSLALNGGMNGLYGHGNASMNGLQTINHHVSSNNLIYMAPPTQNRRTTPLPWLPPTQI